MDENEQNEIKPTEYKEIGEFTESPGYTPAAEPLEKFETFEGYGANEPEESPSEAETAKEPNPANEVAPETDPTVEPANEVQPESSLFAELDGFKEVENFPEPVPEPEAVTDFSTGHWAVDPKPQSGTPQTVMETRQTESLILPDDIPTIPPQAEDLPKAAEIQPEPLPQVVEVVDPQATVLASTAFANSVGSAKEGTQPVLTSRTQPNRIARQDQQKPSPTQNKNQPKGPKPPKNKKKGSGCFGRSLLYAAIAFLVLMLGVAIFAIYKYFDIAKTLPAVDELQNRASQFETTRILDRNGGILYEIVDPNAGKRTYVPLDRISPYLIAATIATEDKEYYNHPGFDVFALGRALYTNYTSGEI